MPLEDRDWFRSYRQWTRRRTRWARLVRRTLVALGTRGLKLFFAAFLLGYVAVAFVHLTNGMEFRTSLGAAFQDARLAMTCPTNLRLQWEFIDRSQIEQIAFGRSLNRGEHVYSDICSAEQFPPQGWAENQPGAPPWREGTAGPTPSAIPSLKPTPIPTVSPGQTPPDRNDSLVPRPIPSLSPAPAVAPTDEADLKNHMLGLVNRDRQANGLGPVALGDNPASQEHAEEMLAHSYLSHWGLELAKRLW